MVYEKNIGDYEYKNGIKMISSLGTQTIQINENLKDYTIEEIADAIVEKYGIEKGILKILNVEFTYVKESKNQEV
jgi:hypothetical protein